MADVNLPSISELSQMQFLAPGQYQTAQQNINLANQFQNQNLHQGEANLQSTLLKNSFDELNNPISLQGNQGLADTRTAEAILKGIDAKQRQSLAPEEQEAKRAKFIKDASDEKLADLMNRTQTDMMNPDAPPEKQQAAKEAFERSSKEWSARLKAKDELKKQQEEYAAKGGIADKEIAGRADVANIMAGSREKVAGMRQKSAQDYSDQIINAKTPLHRAGVADGWANKMDQSGDTEMGDWYRQKAAQFRAEDIASRAAGAGVTATTKMDMGVAANTGKIQNQENPVPPVPTVAPAPRRNSQMQGSVVPPSQQRSANDAALEVKQREFNNAVARGDMQLAQSLQKEMEASVQGKGPLNSGGVTKPQPTIRDDGKVNVVRPDGKAGWISKSDLDEAIKNGWKTK